MGTKSVDYKSLKVKLRNDSSIPPHEGWQWKSSVERSGTEIVADSLTRIFRGACPNN